MISEQRPDDQGPALQRSGDGAFSTENVTKQRALFGDQHGEILGERERSAV